MPPPPPAPGYLRSLGSPTAPEATLPTAIAKRGIVLAMLALFFLLTSCAPRVTLTSPAPQSDLEHNVRVKKEFLVFNPYYEESIAERGARVRALRDQVHERETSGKNTSCSRQILSEIEWLITQTADFKRLDQRIHDLELCLADPEHEAWAEEQDPVDGSWGRCYTEWFFKVAASYDHLDKQLKRNQKPILEPRFLDRINSPDKLAHYLTSVSVSDISHTGIDQYREFNESLSNLMRLILRGRPTDYAYQPKLRENLLDLILNRFRNPATGWWGESYVRDGHVQFVDSLSMTFHVVSYLHGNVPDLPKVLNTTLAVKDLPYPVGWLWNGQYWNHNNMDVATLFSFSWSSASDEQRQAMATELNKMLHWCLKESLQADGSFKPHAADGSVEEGIYYGASFLARIGFFDKSKRFWTDQDFPEADGVRQKIIAYIEKYRDSGGAGGNYYSSAMEQLNHPSVSSE
jgi:hypothetical protein